MQNFPRAVPPQTHSYFSNELHMFVKASPHSDSSQCSVFSQSLVDADYFLNLRQAL